jgi:hypothetical protein
MIPWLRMTSRLSTSWRADELAGYQRVEGNMMSKMKLENISSKARRSPLGCRNISISH